MTNLTNQIWLMAK